MNNSRLVPHIDHTEAASPGAKQDVVQVVADQRENVTNPVRLNGIHKQFGA
jgi:hypothetical protein